jgi:hypothetical protein
MVTLSHPSSLSRRLRHDQPTADTVSLACLDQGPTTALIHRAGTYSSLRDDFALADLIRWEEGILDQDGAHALRHHAYIGMNIRRV